MIEKTTGIYCIENVVNGKKYIGCAIDIERRLKRHFYDLKHDKHDNSYLQRSYNKYGKENFKHYIIQLLAKDEDLLECMEIYWIVYYNAFIEDGGGYNMTRGGYGNLGRAMSEESRAKMSIAAKGRIMSEETRRILSEINTGKKQSEEQKKKMSEMFAGEKNPYFGKTHTEEIREKIKRNRKVPTITEDGLERIRVSAQGRKVKSSTSKYVGVFLNKKHNNWIAAISFDKKLYRVGTFLYEIEAALAYNEFALELYGYNATLNVISQEEIDNLWNLK